MDEFTVDGLIQGRRGFRDAGPRHYAGAGKWLAGLSLLIACQCALGQAMYRIKSLGFLTGCTLNVQTVLGFNEADQMTGQMCTGNGDAHAFLFKHDGTPIVDLGPDQMGSMSQGNALNAAGVVTGFAYDNSGEFSFVSSGDGTPLTKIPGLGGSGVYAYAINDLGQVTGFASKAGDAVSHAFLWRHNGSPTVDLGTLGGDFSSGVAINASGQVTGSADLPGSAAHHAFLWRNNGTPMVDLGTLGGNFSNAVGLNASGQVTGASTPAGTNRKDHAFFWRNDGTPMQDLGTLGGAFSTAVALNDSGQVTGSSSLARRLTEHAFVWLNDGTPMKDLGTFGGKLSLANDINSSGQVTGTATLAGGAQHAFLWRNDGTATQDLNKLIDPADPLKPYVTLTNGVFINDRGDIVADGTDGRFGTVNWYLLRGTVLTLTPRRLAFGNHPIHTSSAAQPVTVTNTGSIAIAITSIALTGTAPGQYTYTDNCGASVAGHATCTIQVTFSPTTKGPKVEFLKVNGGDGGLLSVRLAGKGT